MWQPQSVGRYQDVGSNTFMPLRVDAVGTDLGTDLWVEAGPVMLGVMVTE